MAASLLDWNLTSEVPAPEDTILEILSSPGIAPPRKPQVRGWIRDDAVFSQDRWHTRLAIIEPPTYWRYMQDVPPLPTNG